MDSYYNNTCIIERSLNNRTFWTILCDLQVSRQKGAVVSGVVWMSGERSGRAAGSGISPGTGATTGTSGVTGTTATLATAAGIIAGVGVGRDALDLTLDLSLEGFGEIVLPPPFAVHEGPFPAGRATSPSASLALGLTSTFATSPTETDTLEHLEQLASRQHDLHTPEPVGTPPAYPLPSAGALPLFHHSILHHFRSFTILYYCTAIHATIHELL